VLVLYVARKAGKTGKLSLIRKSGKSDTYDTGALPDPGLSLQALAALSGGWKGPPQPGVSMVSLVRHLILSAAVLATALALSDPVGAQVSPQPSGQLAPEAPDSSANETAAAQPMSSDTTPMPCCRPDEPGFDAFCWLEEAPCGDSARLWLRGQYLLWWTKGNRLPALVSTSPLATQWDQAGVPGTPGFDVLFGNQSIANEDRGGGWLTLGYWLNDSRTLGLQVDWFLVGDDKSTGRFAAASDGTPILARPFYDVDLGQPAAAKVAFPGVMTGAIGVASSSELNSGGVLLRRHWRSGSRGRIDLLGGYRHFAFREDLTIAESLKLTAPVDGWDAGTTQDSWDSFATDNDFHGGELGLNAEFYRGSWSLNLLAKLALGNVRQQLKIDGWTTIVTPDPNSQTYEGAGGLLSQPTNIGYHARNEFAVLPELGVNLQYRVTEQFSLTLGYTLVCFSRVLRTGSQIDTAIDGTQPAEHPAAVLRDTGFWAQGISLGAQLAR